VVDFILDVGAVEFAWWQQAPHLHLTVVNKPGSHASRSGQPIKYLAHGYVANPIAVVMMVTWVLTDLAYLVVLHDVKQTEVVLGSGRKVKGGSGELRKSL